MRQFIACTLVLIIGFVAFGHNQADTVQVYFDINGARIVPTVRDNASSMDLFIDKVRDVLRSGSMDHIDVYGYASPDGSLTFNERLSQKRCESLVTEIIKRTGISPEMIHAQFGGVAWDALRDLVESTPQVPEREKVLQILDDKSLKIYQSGAKRIDERKTRLMALAGGAPYRWMLRNLFPRLRMAIAISLYTEPEMITPPATIPEAAIDSISTPQIDQEIAITEKQEVIIPSDTPLLPESPVISERLAPRHVLALKTNLLYYAALMPNLELEWLINDYWSWAVEGNVAWWGDQSRNKSYRLAVLDTEVRRWINPRAPWHGLFIGVFGGGGWYDLSNGGTGYYGEGGMAGLSVGYMWPISRNLSLEAGVGGGYMRTRVREYQHFEGHHIYQRTKYIDYFGPLKLKFSLVWRFLDRNKSKRSLPET